MNTENKPFNPSFLPPVQNQRHEKTFTIPGDPPFSFTITIAVPKVYSATDITILGDWERRLIADYVTSGKVVSDADGSPLPFSESVCSCIAALMEAERRTGSLARWSEIEWATLAYRAPDCFGDVVDWLFSFHKPALPAPSAEASDLPND